MDLATKLFSLSFGVEPNKSTLKEISDVLSSAVLSLADKQKAISEYVDNVEPQTYVATPGQPALVKQERPAKPQVKWAIPEEKLKELLWKRAQLIQLERARLARENMAQVNGSAAGNKKERRRPPKLGKPKSVLEKRAQGQINTDLKTKGPEHKSPGQTQPLVKPTPANSRDRKPTIAKSPQTKTSSPTQNTKSPEGPKAKPGQRQVPK